MADETNSQTGDNQSSEPPAGDTKQPPDFATIANAAASSQLKRFAEKQLPAMVHEAIKPLMEQLAALKTPSQTESDPAPKGKVNPEVAALSAQLEELKKKLGEEAQGRAAAEKKAREDRAFAEMKGHLGRFVRPEQLDVLADYLFKNNVSFGEDGSPVFKGRQKTQYGFDEDVDFPLKDGIEAWTKLETSKAWLPPPSQSTTVAPVARRQVGAPGQLPQNTDFSKMNSQQKAQAASALEAQIASILNERR